MNTILEPHTDTWTPDGCLASVPANDNGWKPTTNVPPAQVDHVALTKRSIERFPTVHAALRPALPPIIALSGPAGSGKSTVSDFLATQYGYTRSKFAKPLKDMCRAIGMTEAMIEGDQKETPVRWLCGKTPRHAMQTLGTEWGRDSLGEDFWVGLWERSVLGRPLTVVDDCRFANEAAAVRRMGGRVIRLTGRGGIAGGHVSEAGGFLVDAVVVNDGSIADLQVRVREVLEGWR